jgi:hypothetical protein
MLLNAILMLLNALLPAAATEATAAILLWKQVPALHLVLLVEAEGWHMMLFLLVPKNLLFEILPPSPLMSGLLHRIPLSILVIVLLMM